MDDWIVRRIVALEQRVAELEKKLRGEPAAPRPGRSRPLPEGWQPQPCDLDWAKEKYPDVNEAREREKFRNYWRSRGDLRKDWDAAYRNWIIKEHEFSEARPSPRPGGPASRAAGIDQANRERLDRVADKLAKVWRPKS